MTDWKAITEQINLIFISAKSHLEKETIQSIEHYIHHSEYEMALEIILLSLIKIKKYPSGVEKENIIYIVKELKLDIENVYDDHFWEKFNQWIKYYPNFSYPDKTLGKIG